MGRGAANEWRRRRRGRACGMEARRLGSHSGKHLARAGGNSLWRFIGTKTFGELLGKIESELADGQRSNQD